MLPLAQISRTRARAWSIPVFPSHVLFAHLTVALLQSNERSPLQVRIEENLV